MEQNKSQNPQVQQHDDDEIPVTLNMVIKWAGLITTVVTVVVSIVWFAALLKADISSVQQDLVSVRKEVEQKNGTQDKEIDKLKDRADNIEKTISEMARKLDVAVHILERIDKKVGNP